jgi:hypothetical protein
MGIGFAGGPKAVAVTAGVALGAAGLGALIAHDANLRDPSGRENRTLTLAAGGAAAAGAAVATGIGLAARNSEGPGAVLAVVAVGLLGLGAYLSGSVAAGSLAVDLLDIGQRK